MKNYKVLISICIILTASLFIGCIKEQNNEFIKNNSIAENKPLNLNSVITEIGSEDCMEFAPQTSNPYSIANMIAAKAELILNDEFECNYTLIEIRATHKYIKFKPENIDQLEILKDDTTLILFDYPMDRKRIKGGTYYRDPLVADGKPNSQWTCISTDQSIPAGVPYELISDLYLPEQDPNLVLYYDTPFDGCINLLIDQAMKRTGNFDTTSYDSTITSGATAKIKINLSPPPKWSPKGTIRRYDNRINANIGLEGVKVRAHRWFETREAITNNIGHYNMGAEFRYPVDYSIKWERQDFDIMNNYIGQAYFNGPNQKSDWNLDIASDKSRHFAHIHLACIDYFYHNNQFSITSPPKNTTTNSRLSIAARYINDGPATGATHAWTRPLGLIWQIIIRDPSKRSDFLYGTTIHELAHYAHWGLDKSKFNNCDLKIAESWADGVEWSYGNWRYGSYGDKEVDINGNNTTTSSTDAFQERPIAGPTYNNDPTYYDTYTPVVVDLLDNNNQRTTPSTHVANPTYWPDDRVTGYSLSQIESSMKKSLTWSDWENNLRNDYSNSTEEFLDELF